MADLGRIITKSSLALKLALIALCVTLLLHVIGYSTDNWTYVKNYHGAVKHGLWKFCICFTAFVRDETCICSSIPAGSGWNVDAVRALESLGLIGIVFVILFATLGAVQDNGQSWKLFSVFTSFATCLVILVGVIIFATSIAAGEYLHFSFALCTVAGCGMFICSCLLVADKNSKPRPDAGTVIHYNNQGAVIESSSMNQGQYVSPQYPTILQPPPYNQVQYFSGHTFTTVSHGSVLPDSSNGQPAYAGQPPGYSVK